MRSNNGFVGIKFELSSSTWTGEDEDGYPVAMHQGQGPAGSGIQGELHHTFGFMSKPLDPERDPSGQIIPGKSCTVLIGTWGNERHIWPLFDPRTILKLPVPKKGGAMFYCAHGSFRSFDGSDGTETAYFPVPGDKAHIMTTGLDGQGRPVVAIEHCDGMAITMLEHSLVIKNAAGDAYIEVNDAGITINGNVVVNGGATIGDPVGAQPAAIGPAVVAYIQSLEQAINSALSVITLIGGGPAAVSAYQATHAPALAALLAAIPAQKTSVA